MTKSLLHDLAWQLKPSVDFAVDAPRGEEMPQGMKAGVFRLPHRLAFVVEHDLAFSIFDDSADARCNLHGDEGSVDEVGVVFDLPDSVGEDEPELALRTGKLPLLQLGHNTAP